ncbi:MAG: hypothetical protein GY719_30255 [bacterium]|nr:hypothetical protein [bacterium]
MARFVVVVLLLTLALAPATGAQTTDRGGTPFAGWFDAFHKVIDWLFGWIPTRPAPDETGAYIELSGVQSTTANHGACIEPSGITGPPAGGATMRSAPRRHGACIEPSGLTARPDPSGSPGRSMPHHAIR